MGNVLGGTDAVQKLASLPIFELRVFAEQKRRHGFLPLTSLSAIAQDYTKNTAIEYLLQYLLEKVKKHTLAKTAVENIAEMESP